MAANILVIEDDPDINESVAVRLRADGHAVTQAYSGSEALLVLERAAFDVVVCDLMLPGATGESIVARIRGGASDAAIIVISARSETRDRIGLLSLGADDYLVKPFDLHELAARVKVQLRHRAARAQAGGTLDEGTDSSPGGAASGAGSAAPNPAAFVIGAWTIDQDARTLAAAGEDVPLTRIEYNIVELLARHPKKVFTRRELYEFAWNEPFTCDDNTVNVHISNIRAKLKPSGTDGYIKTVWSLGFRLDCDDA